MTLATRCPACGTVFRVVQDQLRVSQGWVRCGRCAEAFNAAESMVDPPSPSSRLADVAFEPALPMQLPASPAFETQVPNPWPAQTSARSMPVDSRSEGWQEPAADPALAPPASSSLLELPPGVEVVASDGALSGPLPVPTTPQGRSEPGFDLIDDIFVGPDTTQTTQRSQALSAADPIATAPPAAADLTSAAAATLAPAAPLQPPSFVTQAERAERWRRPRVRFALALGCLVSALGLAAQVTYTLRDRIAASSSGLRAAVLQACAKLGCRVGDYRQIDALTVESSGLVRVEGAPVYRLSVTLRNRAAVEVAAPALDLSLTDAQGRAIARRVLQMSDLNLPLRTLKAGTELPIQVPLGIADRQVSGYTVEIFYP